jgi:hypothetical protein
LPKFITKPRRDWVTKAAEAGDWSEREGRARRGLARSGAEIRQSRSRKDAGEKIRTFEGPAWEKEPEPTIPDDPELLPPDEVSPVDDEVDALPEDAEEAKLAARESNREATLREVYLSYREKGGHLELPDELFDHYGRVPVSEIDRSWAIDMACVLYRGHPVAYRGLLLNLSDILGLKIDCGVRGEGAWIPWDDMRRLEWSQRAHEELERDREWDNLTDEEIEEIEEAERQYEERCAEYMRQVEQREWEQRHNWAGITRPHPEEDPSSYEPALPIRYPAWRWKNYDYRSTGIQYKPSIADKYKRDVYVPAERRGLPLKGRKTGRPANPNKLTNAEKQKRYRERVKLKKQTA